MGKSRLDLLYYFALFYLLLLFKDEERSSFLSIKLLVDHESTRSSPTKIANNNSKSSQEQEEDLLSTDDSGNIDLPSFINEVKYFQSTSRAAIGAFTDSHTLAFSEPFEVGNKCFRMFGIARKRSACTTFTSHSCYECVGVLNTPDEYSFTSRSNPASLFMSLNVDLWETFADFFILLVLLDILLLITLRWKTLSTTKLKVKIFGKNSTRFVFPSLPNFSKTCGTLIVLSSLSSTGSCSSITSIMMASPNYTTFHTPWTSEAIVNGSTLMPFSPSLNSSFTNFTQSRSSSTGVNNVSLGSSSSLGSTVSTETITPLNKSSLTPGGSITAYSTPLNSDSFHFSVINLTSATVDSSINKTPTPSSLAVQTQSLTTFTSPSITLDSSTSKTHSSISRFETIVSYFSVLNESVTLTPTMMQSSKYQTSPVVFIEASSTLHRTSQAGVALSQSTSVALHSNEGPFPSESVVTSTMFNSTQGLLPSSEFVNSLTSLMLKSTTVSSSESLNIDLAVNSSLRLTVPAKFSSLTSSTLLSSMPPTQNYFSISTASSPLESSLSFQTSSTRTTLLNLTMSSELSKSFPSIPPQSSTASMSSSLKSRQPPLPSTSSSSSSSSSSLSSSLSLLSSLLPLSLPSPSPPTTSSLSPLPSSAPSESSSQSSLISQPSSSQSLLLSSTPPSVPSSSLSLPSRQSPSLFQLPTLSSLETTLKSRPSPSLSPPLSSQSSSLPSTSPNATSPSTPTRTSAAAAAAAAAATPFESPSHTSLTSEQSSSQSPLLSSSPPPLSSLPPSSSSTALFQLPPPSPLPTTQHLSSSRLSPASLTAVTPSELLATSSVLSTFSTISRNVSSQHQTPQMSLLNNSTPSELLATSLVLSTFSTISRNVSSQHQTPQLSLLDNSSTVNLTSKTTHQVIASATFSEISQQTAMSSASSSVTHYQPSASDATRIIKLNFSLLNEEFHSDLSNESSARFMDLSQRVNSTLWKLFNSAVEGLEEIRILQFSNGSVKVDSELLVSNSSNATAQDFKQTLIRSNGTSNDEGFIFGKIAAREICTLGFCLNSGSCNDSDDGATCRCSIGFVGSRCAQKAVIAVNGNYTQWSDFSKCSKTCGGGQRSRGRTCTYPSPKNGGQDCKELGRDVEYVDCNGDVRCPISTEVWIAIGVSCGVFLLILILVVVCFLRRRRKRADQRNGMSSSINAYSNGHNTMIPLQVIYEDKTVPKTSPKGHLNPEFIGDDDDDDNDIYKAQLLLFLRQSHLIRPNIYPDEQDNESESSYNSRKMSAISTASDKNQLDKNGPTETAPVPEDKQEGITVQGEKVLPTTELW